MHIQPKRARFDRGFLTEKNDNQCLAAYLSLSVVWHARTNNEMLRIFHGNLVSKKGVDQCPKSFKWKWWYFWWCCGDDLDNQYYVCFELVFKQDDNYSNRDGNQQNPGKAFKECTVVCLNHYVLEQGGWVWSHIFQEPKSSEIADMIIPDPRSCDRMRAELCPWSCESPNLMRSQLR